MLTDMSEMAMGSRLQSSGTLQSPDARRNIPIINCWMKLRHSLVYYENKAFRRVMSFSYIVRRSKAERGPPLTIPVPMIPAALFAILAISRLGAIHAVVFGGFAPASLAQRIEASKPRAIMTASCGIEGAKAPMDYKPFIEGAIQKSSFKPEKVIVWQRAELKWEPIVEDKGERNWQDLVKNARSRGVKADPVPIKSNEGVYIIYTSGQCFAFYAVDWSDPVRMMFGITKCMV